MSKNICFKDFFLLEALSQENKAKFRELTKKLHPDINKSPDSLIKMQKLNSVKDNDEEFIKFYNEIMGLNNERQQYNYQKDTQSQEKVIKKPSHFKTEEDWKKWHEKVVKERLKRQEKIRKIQRGY